ncbi:MAG: hypothetical protein ABH845_03785 [Candidatus Omnitrophota bacterium]
MRATTRVPTPSYLGLFLICGSLLTFELLLTRLFSVALWYHFGYFAISIALFGRGTGGIFVQLFPDHFPGKPEELPFFLGLCSLASGVTMFVPAFILLRVRFPVELFLELSTKTYIFLTALFLIAAIPFFFGGLITTLLFRTFSGSISKLYFMDLLGASAGCLATYLCLGSFGAPTALLLNSAVACAGGVSFLAAAGSRRTRFFLPAAILITASCLVLAGYGAKSGVFDLRFAKGYDRSKDEFVRWNAISRVSVFDCETKSPAEKIARFVWGVSPHYKGDFPEMKCLDIDAQAGTFLIRFQNDWRSVAYTTQDPPSIVHYLKDRPETLIIGAGGGKDVLAALSLGAEHVTAVELNPIIVHDVMLKRYKDYTGALYQHPKVTAVAAEGRSYLTRSKKAYDIIQLAFVDTSAATAGGAYVLAENTLYTVEAFTEYLTHLKEGGIFSVSWVDVPGLYGGTRLVSLGIAALEKLGIHEIPSHLIVFTHLSQPQWAIRTVLLKRTPFTDEEERHVASLCQKLGFKITYSPHHPTGAFISKLILHQSRAGLYRSLTLDISPVTDDRPFFFYQDRIGYFFRFLGKKRLPGLTYGVGLQLLTRTLLVASVLVILFFMGPLLLSLRHRTKLEMRVTTASIPYLLYFSCLGMGFMFLEIGLLQNSSFSSGILFTR